MYKKKINFNNLGCEYVTKIRNSVVHIRKLLTMRKGYKCNTRKGFLSSLVTGLSLFEFPRSQFPSSSPTTPNPNNRLRKKRYGVSKFPPPLTGDGSRFGTESLLHPLHPTKLPHILVSQYLYKQVPCYCYLFIYFLVTLHVPLLV